MIVDTEKVVDYLHKQHKSNYKFQNKNETSKNARIPKSTVKKNVNDKISKKKKGHKAVY